MTQGATRENVLLSVITPAYNEEKNLPLMHERLRSALDEAGVGWEWLIIDDASADDTYAVASAIAERDHRVCVVRFSRNFGSHMGIICGLERARGDCAVAMAADLQDPPESIPALLGEWRAGSQIVWAARTAREGEARSTIAFARFYYWIMRSIAGLKNTPATGADFMLLDRVVVDAVSRFQERNTSLFALLTWMGFRQTTVYYEKKARLHGRSGWTLRKKFKLVIDSLTSFTFLPIRWMSVAGLAISVVGLVYAVLVVLNAFLGRPAEGWTSIMVAVLILGGGQMCMLGVLGEYIWRGLDEGRRRPRYIVERVVAAPVGTSPAERETSRADTAGSALRTETGRVP
jgi:dolichol-phosphate mannosyltransferase